MTTKGKIGSITAASLATLICGTVSTNYVGNSGSGSVSVTYEQLVNSSTEQTSLSEGAVEVTVYSSTTTQTTSAPQAATAPTALASTAAITSASVTAATSASSILTTAAVTTAAEPVVIDDEIAVTVYVSNSGKYHSKSNCSGMKNYTEMSLDEAIGAGHVACKKCW